MGRSFESVRMGVKGVARRWARAARPLRDGGREHGKKVAAMAEKHSSEGFYAVDDPLESAVFSALIELLMELDGTDVDP